MTPDPPMPDEQAREQHDATLRSLEEGKLSLEEAIAAVARGREYLQLCERKLEEARQRIESLPVKEEPLPEHEAPHPATVADLRAERARAPGQPQGEIPFERPSVGSDGASRSISGRSPPGSPGRKTPHSCNDRRSISGEV